MTSVKVIFFVPEIFSPIESPQQNACSDSIIRVADGIMCECSVEATWKYSCGFSSDMLLSPELCLHSCNKCCFIKETNVFIFHYHILVCVKCIWLAFKFAEHKCLISCEDMLRYVVLKVELAAITHYTLCCSCALFPLLYPTPAPQKLISWKYPR